MTQERRWRTSARFDTKRPKESAGRKTLRDREQRLIALVVNLAKAVRIQDAGCKSRRCRVRRLTAEEVTEGARLRVTVAGRPVAELVPVGEGRRFVPRSAVERLLLEAPLDTGFIEEIDAVTVATIEEL